MGYGKEINRLFAEVILVIMLAAVTARADQVSCALIPLNADTIANVGVLVPVKAKLTGVSLQVRIITPPDNYSDCSQQGLCKPPHTDIANVVHWDVPDAEDMRGLGYAVYNAKGAPTKNVRLCYSFRMTDQESSAGRLDSKFIDVKPYDLWDEFLKSRKNY